eukprot:9080661-Pyramimonas_sp.AAC.1
MGSSLRTSRTRCVAMNCCIVAMSLSFRVFHQRRCAAQRRTRSVWARLSRLGDPWRETARDVWERKG